jgi:protein SCO1/2
MNPLRIVRIVAWALVAIVVIGGGALTIGKLLNPDGGIAGSSLVASSGVANIGGPFKLVDQKGNEITEEALQGHPSLVFFGFTFCPEVCPTTLADMTLWLKDLGPDAEKLKVYFVSVDPERDTPKQMADYLSAFDPRITGITGKPDDVYAMLKAYRVYYRKVDLGNGDYTMDHPGSVYIFDSKGSFSGAIDYNEKEDVVVAKLKKLVGV